MRIMICGGGSSGRHVAEVLAAVHEVTVVDLRADRAGPPAANLRYVVGDATDPGVLMAAGARTADVLVAVTHDDATNLVIALIAKHHLAVRTTVARVHDPAHEWLFSPGAGIDLVVSAAELVARVVQEEITAGDLVTLLRLRGSGIAVTETTLPPGAAIAGTDVGRARLPDGIALTAILRGGAILLPERAGTLRAGDVVVALCEPGREHLLHSVLVGEPR